MDAGLSEEHRELAATIRDALDTGGSATRWPDIATEFDRELWTTLCEQIGIAALPIPEDSGGFGFGYLESHIVLE